MARTATQVAAQRTVAQKRAVKGLPYVKPEPKAEQDAAPAHAPAHAPAAASAPAEDRKPKARRRGVAAALRQIRHFREDKKLKIRKLPFQRLVRRAAQAADGDGFRWEARALLLVQEAVEKMIITAAEFARLAVHHANRVTCMPKDIFLARRMHRRPELTEEIIAAAAPASYN